MAYVTYTAVDRDSLVSGHSAGTSYDLDFRAASIARPRKRDVEASVSLSGKTETLFNRQDKVWSITTTLVSDADYAQWEEFLDSVAAGEPFTLDAYASGAASPSDPKTVVLVGDPTEPHEAKTMKRRISFKAREV